METILLHFLVADIKLTCETRSGAFYFAENWKEILLQGKEILDL